MFGTTAHFATGLVAVLLAALIWAPPAAAQTSDAAGIVASVAVESDDVVTVTAGRDLLFGTHFATEGVIENGPSGQWTVTTSPLNTIVDYTLTLPGTLVNVNDPASSVPVTYGANSLRAECETSAGAGADQTGDPSAGLSGCNVENNISRGHVELGWGTGPDGVTVDISSAADGLYTGTIVLTATVK